LVLEFSKQDGLYAGRVFDPLGAIWCDYTTDFATVAGKLMSRLEYLASVTRVSSRSINTTLSLVPPDQDEFYALIKNYAEDFHRLMLPEEGVERFLGNASFRCNKSGFPSFRGEESRSKRHLMEYWHIKAEIAYGNLEDIIKIVEDIIVYLTQKCQQNSIELMKILETKFCLDGLKVPFKRISYEDAINHLQNKGFKIKFGPTANETLEVKVKPPRTNVASKIAENTFLKFI